MAAFIFDMDGCLLDSIWLWLESEQAVLESIGIEMTKERRDELNTLTLEEAGAWFHENFGIMSSGEEVVKMIMGKMLDAYRTRVEAKPGVLDFVRAVYEAGAPMCVLSSSPQAFLQAGLGHAGLLPYFREDLIISAEDRGWAKRKHSTFQEVCELLGTEPADTWLFDDSQYAVAVAHECGLHVVGTFSSDSCGTHEELGRNADMVVDDFTTLDPNDFL